MTFSPRLVAAQRLLMDSDHLIQPSTSHFSYSPFDSPLLGIIFRRLLAARVAAMPTAYRIHYTSLGSSCLGVSSLVKRYRLRLLLFLMQKQKLSFFVTPQMTSRFPLVLHTSHRVNLCWSAFCTVSRQLDPSASRIGRSSDTGRCQRSEFNRPCLLIRKRC